MRLPNSLTSVVVMSVWLAATGAALSQSDPAAAEEMQRFPPTPFGAVFPSGTFKNLNQAAGPSVIDLGQVIGKKPVVLFYWIAGNPRADQVLAEVQERVSALGSERIALFVVAIQRPGRGMEFIRQGIETVGIRVPVLDDEKFEIGQRLRVQSVPNITVLDAEGRLRLTNGASLLQTLEYNMDVAGALERVASKGSLGTYGYLARYFPVTELVGQACPDFKAPLLSDSVEQRWSSLLDDKKLNVLIFWSVDCPHCRESLPEINAWLRANPEGLNVLSAASVTSEAAREKTKEFCDLNQFVFRTLVDRDLEISKLYQVTSTPTFVIIRPDGVIDDVILTGGEGLQRALDEKRRKILNAG